MDQYQNPYSPVLSSDAPNQQTSNPIWQGVIRSLLYSAATIVGFYLLIKSAVVIDSVFLGEGRLKGHTATSICAQYFRLMSVITMLVGFGTFSYHAGSRRINSVFCLVALAISGILGSRLLFFVIPEAMRYIELEHPPIYPAELIAYFVAYLATSWLLVVIGRNSGRLMTEDKDRFA